MTNRELAWRVFAGEYNKCTLEIASGTGNKNGNGKVGEREPGYLVSPLGARINRLFIVGVLTELEKLERNGNAYYRARISDRTGVFYVYAGQYDAEVIKTLSKLEPPAYVAVVGKSRKYSPSEGVTYVSIRPESITVVDKSVRDYWLLDASKSIKTRIEAMLEVQQMAQPTTDKLVALGFDASYAQGVIDAIGHYGEFDIAYYKNILLDVLRYIATGNDDGYVNSGDDLSKKTDELDVEFKTGEEYNAAKDKDSENENDELVFEPNQDQNQEPIEDDAEVLAKEEQLLQIISKKKGKKYKDGVPWHDLMNQAVDGGLDKNVIEDLVNNLLNKGKVYEPILGRIKCTKND